MKTILISSGLFVLLLAVGLIVGCSSDDSPTEPGNGDDPPQTNVPEIPVPSSPTLISGPLVSSRTAVERWAFSRALLTLAILSAWACRSPWERLMRATSMPAPINSKMERSDLQLGPRVAIILVLFFLYIGSLIEGDSMVKWKV